MLGLDYSAGRPRGSEVKRLGYGFVIRYCGRPGARKNATRAEVDDMIAHGVSVALVFETTAARAGEGFDAGVADARAATAHQAALGIPASRPIYYAVDYDANPDAVIPYFRGVNSVAGPDSAYGGFRVVQRLKNDGLVVDIWQTVAWSRGRRDPRIDVFQRLGYVTVDGIQCDVNESFTTDFGQYPIEEDTVTPEQQAALFYVRDQLQLMDKRRRDAGLPHKLPGDLLLDDHDRGARTERMVTALAATCGQIAAAVADGDLDPDAVLARVDTAVREATTQVVNETVLPALRAVVEDVLGDDNAKQADAIVTELADRLRPAA